LEVLFVTAKKFLTVDAVSATLTPWLTSDLSIEAEKWSIGRANPPGKRFILKFNLLPLQNARLVQTVASSLKLENGTYRQFAAKAVDETMVSLAIHRDESPKERTQRIMGTVAKKALAALHPGITNCYTFKSKKLDTTVLKAGDDPAELLCIMQPTTVKIERNGFHWNYEALDTLPINKNALLDTIMELSDRPEEAMSFRV